VKSTKAHDESDPSEALSALPQGWCWSPLGELADLINGDRGKNYPSGTAFVEQGIPFINAGHLCNGSVALDEMNFITEDRFALLNSGKVRVGDVLYCLRGSLGKAAVVTNIEKAAIASSLVIIRTTDRCLPAYVYSYLVSPIGRAMIERYDNGSAQPNLSAKNVERFRTPLAPLEEQRRICEALDSYLTRLDAAAEGLKRVGANLKRYRASVLKAAVEGRLVPTEAELAKREGRAYEPASELLARILKERRRRWEQAELAKMKAKGESPKNDAWKSKYQDPAAPDTTNLPSLPEGWCWATVEQLAAHEEYSLAIGPFGSNLKVVDYTDDGVPLVFVRNIRAEQFKDLDDKFVTAKKAKELKAHTIAGGDLLVTKMGDPPGDVAIYPIGAPDAVITADCIKVRAFPSLCTEFLLWIFRSASVQSSILDITKGVAQKKVSLGRFASVAVPLAPLAEQVRIAGEASKLQSQSAHTTTSVLNVRDRISRLRQSILTWAFEGKLVNQDPNDEPASVLLERIRQQRAASEAASKPACVARKKAR
jgi:type I restriction enzyme S subunit